MELNEIQIKRTRYILIITYGKDAELRDYRDIRGFLNCENIDEALEIASKYYSKITKDDKAVYQVTDDIFGYEYIKSVRVKHIESEKEFCLTIRLISDLDFMKEPHNAMS